jgi:hypothetical protein
MGMRIFSITIDSYWVTMYWNKTGSSIQSPFAVKTKSTPSPSLKVLAYKRQKVTMWWG